jgi:hypothetical protein
VFTPLEDARRAAERPFPTVSHNAVMSGRRDTVVGAICGVGLLGSTLWLVGWTPKHPLAVAGLVSLFFCSVLGFVVIVRPIWRTWHAGKRLGGAAAAAGVATGLLLALLQVLPTSSSAPAANRDHTPPAELSTPSASPSTPSVTSVRLVRPFDLDANLLPPYKAGHHIKKGAECWDGYESSDPESLRCSTDSEIFDPCWEGGPRVACLSDPWTATVTVIDNPTVKRSFSETRIGPTPWAIEVVNPLDASQRLRCGFAGGATGSVAGMRVNWACYLDTASSSEYMGDALGDPHVLGDRPWTVFYAAKGSSEVEETSVITVWR